MPRGQTGVSPFSRPPAGIWRILIIAPSTAVALKTSPSAYGGFPPGRDLPGGADGGPLPADFVEKVGA